MAIKPYNTNPKQKGTDLMFNTLNPAQEVALVKAIKPNTETLQHSNQGQMIEHSGSVAVIMDYSFKVCADEQYTPTVHTPVKAVLAILAEQSPEMAEAVKNAMNEALTLQAKSQAGDDEANTQLKALLKDAPKADKDVSDILASLPKSTRKGKIVQVETEVQSFDVATVKQALIDQQAKAVKEQQDKLNALTALLA